MSEDMIPDSEWYCKMCSYVDWNGPFGGRKKARLMPNTCVVFS
jgi:hypothetical protein